MNRTTAKPLPMWIAPGVAIMVVLVLQPSAKAAGTEIPGMKYNLTEKLTYDDNLFRQPASSTLSGSDGNLHRLDLIKATSIGLNGIWSIGRQGVDLSAYATDNRYQHNSSLNYIGGNASLLWDWRLGGAWSGDFGTQYIRTLADFANNEILSKDIVSVWDSFGDASYQLGQRWKLNAGIRQSSASHSAFVRRVDNADTRTQKLGIEYQISANGSLGWDYRHATAGYDGDGATLGLNFDRNYEENSSLFHISYQLSGKTGLDAQAGYVHRDYPNSAIGDFSGNTWRAALTWKPTVKTEVKFTGWRELQAYIDAESDYFVSKVRAVEVKWSPTDKMDLAINASRNDQTYLGSALLSLTLPARRDRVSDIGAVLKYKPIRALEVDFAYRNEDRRSNQPLLGYADNLFSLNLRFTF